MSDSATANLDVVIRFLAQGDLKSITAAQVQGAQAELAKLGSGGAAVASKAGEQLGQHTAEGMSHALEHHLKVHFANLIGSLAGAPGLGRLAAMGGAGVMGAMGFAVVEKGVEAIKEKLKEVAEEHTALGALADRMRGMEGFSPEFLHSLHEAAEGMADGKTKTTEWLNIFGELAHNGAGKEQIEGLAGEVKSLAALLGGDAKAATEAMVAALNEDYEALAKVGIAIGENMSASEALASVHAQLAARGRDLGTAAESSATSLHRFKVIAGQVKSEVEGIKSATEGAAESMASMVAKIGELKAAEKQEADDAEKVALSRVEKQVAQGTISRESADKEIARIKAVAASRRLAAEESGFRQERGALLGGLTGARAEQEEMGQQLIDQQKKVAEAQKVEEVRAELAKRVREINEAQLQAAGESDHYDPAGDKALQAEKERIQKQMKELGPSTLGDETDRLNEMEKGFKGPLEALYKEINKFTEQLESLERRHEATMKHLGAESEVGANETAAKAATDKEARRKQLEGEVRNFESQRSKNQRMGLPDPERPADLKGLNWEYDASTHGVKFTKAAGNGVRELGGLVSEFAGEVSATVAEVKRSLAEARSRMRNDGGLVK